MPSILLVDDDEHVRALLELSLVRDGYDVTMAGSGAEALEALRDLRPDIVLCDVEMPGMTGFELLRQLRSTSEGRDLSFLFLTARRSDDDVVQGLDLGADDYLRKPFSMPELLARLRAKIARPPVPVAMLDELDLEVQRAADVQRALLPSEPPAVPGFEIAGACVSSRSVGGDLYDWYAAPDGAFITLADVMGKGMAGAILMATVRSVLRAAAGAASPGAAVRDAAAVLESDLQRTGSFVTLFHARIDAETGVIRYVDAGHGLTVVARADGSVERLPVRGLPVGVVPDADWAEGAVVLAPGDELVVVSDGVLELYGEPTSEAELVDVLDRVGALAASEPTAGGVVSALTTITGDHGDDV
ncbi:MAG TPA: SpoIIE family protein phosphatase, partial [Acidimicrobiales bacterium]|nr:SpoIIE family protein phosphatase [Acidimicrobiales bacterium]